MGKYLYESHLGGIYLLDEYEEPEYCEICGDSDRYLGEVEDMEELAVLMFKEHYTNDDIEEKIGYSITIEKVREVEF